VAGGKSDQLIVQSPGVRPGQTAVADHRAGVHANQAAGLSHPAAFLDVLQYGQNLLVRQAGTKERGAFPFRESTVTGSTIQQADSARLAEVAAHRQIPPTAVAVIRAVNTLATEPR